MEKTEIVVAKHSDERTLRELCLAKKKKKRQKAALAKLVFNVVIC